MRVDQATFAAHGAALLAAAGRLFRARGLDGVSLAEVSRAAGLTHGAFYGHYPSKDGLAEAVCRESLQNSAERWRARARAAPSDPLGAIIDAYLTEAHRDQPGPDGCTLSALGPEAARGRDAVAAALADGTRALLGVLEEVLAQTAPSATAQARGGVAAALLATMAGGLLVARALRPDAEKSRAALQAARLAARNLIPTET